MSIATPAVEYETIVVGAACLVKDVLRRLKVVSVIDEALTAQPQVEATYGTLAQAIIVNRMTLDPCPLYELSTWAAQHGIDRLFGIQAGWLDDDRLGAMLEALARHQVTIWSGLLGQAVREFALDLGEWHADTTSIYFEGAYEDAAGQPQGGGERVPRICRGYNKDGKWRNVQIVLSLITSRRIPLWYRPWDGNQNDDGVYLPDVAALRETVLAPHNAILVGDRKLASTENLRTLCRLDQWFVTAHPWTKPAQEAWLKTAAQVEAGERSWTIAPYVSQREERKPVDERAEYRVLEIPRELKDPQTGKSYALRWVFTWSSGQAQRDEQIREKALAAGEETLRRIAGRLGKQHYQHRAMIESRLEKALGEAKARAYFITTLTGSDAEQGWALRWERQEAAIAEAARFDGVSLLCANIPPEHLPTAETLAIYKRQCYTEQTIDFLKSPVKIRPMWLHKPERLAGLTLLIMIAVLVATLIEDAVCRWITQTGRRVYGLMPQGRDTTHPTARRVLRAFADYALVIARTEDGAESVHYPKFRPAQQQIWEILKLPPWPA